MKILGPEKRKIFRPTANQFRSVSFLMRKFGVFPHLTFVRSNGIFEVVGLDSLHSRFFNTFCHFNFNDCHLKRKEKIRWNKTRVWLIFCPWILVITFSLPQLQHHLQQRQQQQHQQLGATAERRCRRRPRAKARQLNVVYERVNNDRHKTYSLAT